MKPYVVRQGDYLDKLAFVLGFDAEEVWQHPKNAELRASRDRNILHPGDILHVPDPPSKRLPLTKGTVNRYVVTVPTTWVALRFQHRQGPRASEEYTVYGLGAPRTGRTDGEGVLRVEVPVNLREFTVVFTEANLSHAVKLGDLDPLDEPAGVRKRLQHLGFGNATEGASEEHRAGSDVEAIRSFQAARGLPVTGKVDEVTRQALLVAHGI